MRKANESSECTYETPIYQQLDFYRLDRATRRHEATFHCNKFSACEVAITRRGAYARSIKEFRSTEAHWIIQLPVSINISANAEVKKKKKKKKYSEI